MESKVNIDITKTQAIVCEKCNNQVFTEGVLLRKASRFLTGTNKDAIIPMQVFACSMCGHVNDDFLPEELKQKPEPPKSQTVTQY
jgi:hypothetical protein